MNQKKSRESLSKFFYDYLPLIVFFLVYKFSKSPQPLIAATISMVAVTFVSLIVGYIITRKISFVALFSGSILGIFGGLTIFFKDETFIKIKPTIINLMFATILFYGNFTKKPFLSYLLGTQIKISNNAWFILAKRWALYFIALAIVNEIIWHNFPTDFWVKFKVFGMLPLSFIFMASQMPFIMREAEKFEKKNK